MRERQTVEGREKLSILVFLKALSLRFEQRAPHFHCVLQSPLPQLWVEMALAGGGGRENDFAGLFQGHGLVTEEGSSTSSTTSDRAARRQRRWCVVMAAQHLLRWRCLGDV